MKRKLCVILLVCIFLFSNLSINTYAISTNNEKNSNGSSLYGFITTVGPYENVCTNKNKNCRTYNMINDFLRENLSVFWIAEDINILVSPINDSVQTNKFFEKGAFIIPFSGNDVADKKIISIICDYNQTSEIEDNVTKIPIYTILEKQNILSYKLSNVKLIEIKNKVSSVEGWYFGNALNCGFFDIDFVEENDLKNRLNNEHDVIIWPAASKPIDVFIYTSLSTLKKDTTSKIIRNFVSNGGGFLGSCYGADIASCGVFPIPMYLKRRAYNPNLNSYGVFSLADFFTIPVDYVGDVNVKIINKSHPVVYGIHEDIVVDHFEYGPKIITKSEDIEIIAEFDEGQSFLEGSPDYISSKFGEGRIVIFASHPEINMITENKIFSNSLYYITSKDKVHFNIDYPRNLTFFSDILQQTKDLKAVMTGQKSIFNKIRDQVNYTIDCFSSYPDDARDIFKDWFENDSYVLKFLDNLKKIEKASVLINETENFYTNSEKLKEDMQTLLNATPDLVNKSAFYYKKYEKIADFIYRSPFNDSKIFLLIGRSLIKPFFRGMMKELNTLFYSCMYKCYFESTKFLRHHWYEYEASLV